MLHVKTNIHSNGLSFMTLRPECNGLPYPSPQAQHDPYQHLHSFPYEHLVFPPRILGLLCCFQRQLPKFAHQVHEKFMGAMCPHDKMVMKTSFFSSLNTGPYHRIIDPTVNLLETYRDHANLSLGSKFWYALMDKAPPSSASRQQQNTNNNEFVLRGLGSIFKTVNKNTPPQLLVATGGGKQDTKQEITFIDRSTCLQADPIRIHSNSFTIEFDTTNSEVFFRLLIQRCDGPQVNMSPQNCESMYLEQGETHFIPSARTITIGIDERRYFDPLITPSCSNSSQEDVVIRLTQITKHGK